jgi:signal transduction histidine kinase
VPTRNVTAADAGDLSVGGIGTGASPLPRWWLWRWLWPWPGPWRWRWLWDTLGVAFATLLVVYGSIGEAYPTNPADLLPAGTIPPPWPAYLLVGAAGVALLWRHRWPVTVWAFTVVTVSVYALSGYVYGAALVAPTIALYTAVSVSRTWRAVVLGTISIVALLAVGWSPGPFPPLTGPATVVPFEMLVALGLGMATANRRRYIAEIQDRAERAERSRDEEARRRVDSERLRIARELHDVVAHTMATIHVQAAAAAHVLVDPPPQAAEAIAAIRAASKDGLRELRSILDVLRQADDQDPVEPTPSLGELDVLVGTVRRAGLPTEVSIVGDLPPLPPAVDVAAYRIIQESLTNTVRHAGPATARIELAVVGGYLRVEVSDTGVGAGQPRPAGHGLIGMRERAASVGGTLDVRTGPTGGFLVRAVLPVSLGSEREVSPAARRPEPPDLGHPDQGFPDQGRPDEAQGRVDQVAP